MIPRRKISFINNEFLKVIKHVFSNNKSFVNDFSNELKKYFGVKNILLTSSGRDGLIKIIKSLDLKKEDEIIIPAYTLKDLILLIQNLDVKIRFADIIQSDFNVDINSIKSLINHKTKAIIVLHSFGMPANILKITELAKKKGIFVIEDCAHAFGSKLNNKFIGTFGDASFFSFENIKILNTYGGGMILLNNDTLSIKNDLNFKKYSFNNFKKMFFGKLENFLLPLGILNPILFLFSIKNFNKLLVKMYFKLQPKAKNKEYTELQAKIGLIKLNVVNKKIQKRQKLVKIYKKYISNKVILQKERGFSNYYFLTGLIKKDPYIIKKKLLFKGIDIGIGQEVTDDCQKIYPLISDKKLINTDYVYKHIIQLPLYDDLRGKQIIKICKNINKLL